MSARRAAPLSILGTVALAVLFAAPAALARNDRRFEPVGRAEGLVNLSVASLAQDSTGFVWMGTQEGLHRFDGQSMRVFQHDVRDPASLSGNRVSAIVVDPEERMWVATRGGGLCRYVPETETFETWRHDPDDPRSLASDDLVALAVDDDGSLWIGTSREGVDHLVRESGEGAVRFDHVTHEQHGLADDRIRTLRSDGDGTLWIGTMGGLSHLLSEAPVRLETFRHDDANPDSLGDDEVYAVLRDSDGALWVGMWGGGLDRLSDPMATSATAKFEHFRHDDADAFSLQENRVMALLEDRQGTLWVGCLGGGLGEVLAAERRAAVPRFLHHDPETAWSHAIADEAVVSMLEDQAGDLWFGTGGNGVSRLDRSHEPFHLLRRDEGESPTLPEGNVSAVLETRDGALWVATAEGLVRILPVSDRFAPAQVTHLPGAPDDPAGLPDASVDALLEDRRGAIWIGTIGGGLVVVPADQVDAPSPRCRTWVRSADDPTALASDAVLSLLEDQQGRVWVGTYLGLHRAILGEDGLPTSFERFVNDPEDDSTLSSSRIECLAEDDAGMLWVGTYYGLNRLDPTTGKAVRYLPEARVPTSLGNDHVLSVRVDREGRVWAGTLGGGLDELDETGRGFRHHGLREGLPGTIIEGILEDGDGNLWIATTAGLCRLPADGGPPRTWGERDGLQGDVFTRGASHLGAGGRLHFGGTGGLTSFNPEDLAPKGAPPHVVLTGLKLLNRLVAIGPHSVLPRQVSYLPELVLQHADYLFAFEFVALSYRDVDRTRFEYRLESFGDEWIPTEATDRKAVFSGVPPGRYRFQVRAANADGVWSAETASLRVRILPPWWATLWTRASVVLLVVGGLFTWHRLRMARVRQLNALLEVRVAERTADLEAARARLDHASRTDFLTQLPNRRDFVEKAEAALADRRAGGRPFCLALGDIDDFKAINDRRGHDCGDLVLERVAATLRESLAPGDIVARWGGEEFIFLLRDKDAAGAADAAEAVRLAVARLRIPWDGAELAITLTVGVAAMGTDETLDDCTARCDEALYRGKRAGKNRVIAA